MKQRFTSSARWIWESCQRCLANYDERAHRAGTDEETRYRIAVNVLGGAATPEVFELRLLEAFEQYAAEVKGRYDQFMELVPEQILVITDTVSAFENKALADRMVETTRIVERLRGLEGLD